jgi:hypothetical protein
MGPTRSAASCHKHRRAEAGTLLLTVPNELGMEYNANPSGARLVRR